MFEWLNVYKLVIFISLVPVIAMLTPILLSNHRRILRMVVIVFLSGLLSVTSLLWLSKSSWVDESETTIMKHLSSVGTKDIEAYRMIDRNFLFVDNSFNKTLIPYEQGTEGDSTTVAITSRSALLTFIHLLNKHPELVDLVVYDIALRTATPHDGFLKKSLDSLVVLNKLLISYQPLPRDEKTFRFPFKVYGNVRETGNGSAYTSHTVSSGIEPLSLAYKIQAKLEGIDTTEASLCHSLLKEKRANNQYLRRNNFLPKFRLLNEDRLYNRALYHATRPDLRSVAMPVFDIGFLVTPQGRQILVHEMQLRKKRGENNILFLGSFKSPDEDIHATAYGNLHGPTIILNVFNALTEGANHISSIFLIVMTIAYSIIHSVMIGQVMLDLKPKSAAAWFNRCLESWQKKIDENIKKISNKNKKKRSVWQKAGYLAYHFLYLAASFLVIEQLHFCLLLIFLYGCGALNGTLLNATLLILYFVAFEAIMKYFGKHKLFRSR